ncbi:MAG: response regulator [Fibrobacter sp.]|nr:response regulator [Fibrobacter sp.]
MIVFSRTIENENRVRVLYGIILVVVGLAFTTVGVYIFKHYLESVKQETLLAGKMSNARDAETIDGFLAKSESVLRVTARIIEKSLDHGAMQAHIESLLVSEAQYYKRTNEIALSNMFGILREEFFNGGRWTPAAGYVPSNRPWYQNAPMEHGKVALIPTHMTPHGGEQVVTISLRLSDKRSVLAMDLYLKDMLAGVKKSDLSNMLVIIDKKGMVVSHTDITQNGKNYLSADFWGSDEEKLARAITFASEEPFVFNLRGRDYRVFSTLIQGEWYVVRLVEENGLWKTMNYAVARNAILFFMIYVLFILLFTAIFAKYLKLVRVNRSKTAFLTSMSREIRSAVNGILGMNSIVQKELHDDNMKEYSNNIQSAGHSIISLVNDVLDVSKIESGRLSIESMEYDIFTVLQECYNENEPKAKAKGLTFHIDCDPDIPSCLWGDQNRIIQIINNLLSNAVKFTEVGGVSLSVGFDNLPPIGSLRTDDYIMLKIAVKDTGVGIRKEDRDSIFNKYLPKSPKDESDIEGMGLGLSLTQELLAKCGGHMSINSRYGEGSSFLVEIPQLVLNTEPMGDFAMRYRNASRKNKDNAEIFLAPEARILIVDDVELNIKMFRGFLNNSQVKIDEALSGHQCLQLVESRHYDLIFLDHMMPVMDGVDVFRKMRMMDKYPNKNTPVIALVSEGESLTKDSFLAEGFADYLLKPVKERDLHRTMKWYLPKQLVLTPEDLTEPVIPTVNLMNGMSSAASNKIETSYGEGELELRPITAPTLLDRFKAFSEFLDIKAGLNYCADDEEIYVEMLQEYVNSPLCRNVDACYKNSDWDNYRFYMHVLYDSSVAIGAISMAEIFRNLETASRESRMKTVQDTHELAMALHAELIENIQRGLDER